MARDSSLWMGGVEKYMTEDFLQNAFSLMGEEEALKSIKVIKNKFTGNNFVFYVYWVQCWVKHASNEIHNVVRPDFVRNTEVSYGPVSQHFKDFN